ncbi:60S ribosome subunit biogenesis protein NIP7-like protein [Armadillidium nasatum]|uniref:60S ribosome subunit biogenesis protein NIP7 homolog n=1 Tax=Armadillidium nasatum TaxID=96803 RepID=A0A5N5TH31_9CRUS|nr:60S ribosome subunit biogenesis protein NIP7-like protein [Armadillidium nasatum]
MKRLVYSLKSCLNSDNIKQLLVRSDGHYCFRFHKDRVYYVSEKLLVAASSIPFEGIVSVGTCFGKFTKTKKFHLHITALDFLAPYSPYKIIIKQSSENSFLYGNHVLKSGMASITDNTPKYQGGFGVAAKSTTECRVADPPTIVAFHQADIGEYIRKEDTLT